MAPTSHNEALPKYKSDFLEVCLTASVLKFGSFKLKSGRQSPVRPRFNLSLTQRIVCK